MGGPTPDHTFSSFAECAFILSHPQIFTVEHGSFPGAEQIRGRRGVQLIEGRPHNTLHSFLTRYFVSTIGEIREQIIRPFSRADITQCSELADVEILAEVAAPLSLRVIAAVLGFPHRDLDFLAAFAAWRDSITPWVATGGQQAETERRTAVVAASKFREAAMPSIRARKVRPEGDLLSALWSVGADVYPDWDEEDVLDQCRLLLLAGWRLTSGVNKRRA